MVDWQRRKQHENTEGPRLRHCVAQPGDAELDFSPGSPVFLMKAKSCVENSTRVIVDPRAACADSSSSTVACLIGEV